jgi:hypothetical protein
VGFRGLLAAPDGVLAKGYPLDGRLLRLRGSLREQIRGQRLQYGLDVRYAIRTAHCTLMRFKSQLRSLAGLLREVATRSAQLIATTRIQQLQLVVHDWYMSSDRVQVLASYSL